MSSLPTLEDFLAQGLPPHQPEDVTEECSICAVSWCSETTEVVSLPCCHHFHKDCIQRWIEEGPGEVARCPYCRADLCQRLGHVDEESTDPLGSALRTWGWERINHARINLLEDGMVIHRLVGQATDEQEDRIAGTRWADVVVEALEAFAVGRLILLGGAEKFAVVEAIVEALHGIWLERGFDVTEIDYALVVFQDYEENAQTREIRDTYEDAGLARLAAVEERWNFLLEIEAQIREEDEDEDEEDEDEEEEEGGWSPALA